MKVFGYYVYVFLAAAGISHVLFYVPAMPDPMASHFDIRGAADQWSSRAVFFVGAGIVFALVTIIFLALPQIAGRMAGAVQKDCDRSNSSSVAGKGFFRDLFISRMVWAGNVTLAFMSLVLHFVFVANMQPVPKIDVLYFSFALAGYFVLLILWFVSLLRILSKGAQ